MMRIGNQPPAPPVASTTSQPASAPAGSLQSLLAALEQAIQRLQHQQGGAPRTGGGDRVETAPQPPVHRYHPPSHFPRWEPVKPPSTGPSLPPVVKHPEHPDFPDLPPQACGSGGEEGGVVRKGLAGGTVGT